MVVVVKTQPLQSIVCVAILAAFVIVQPNLPCSVRVDVQVGAAVVVGAAGAEEFCARATEPRSPMRIVEIYIAGVV